VRVKGSKPRMWSNLRGPFHATFVVP